ncbi:sugar O-acyltransferase (sialic acid O-acetyltransferase NeuD family) [Aeromonas sp. BIGb0405]|uniref:NeuD/PglB/VioB family sugar acetyltransferase n=1 Tax=Aeromonas sp. BIGb0405 TaxID=2940592 RepID=UPI002169152A|nr:NeuD/PglB/VioB family sugar acetyltransferase [Aeromonas sp. BIGb0405]MCS3455398.1 sugar O-acyltransferase (sialic acid O-acetyltransferase NeuD family) [Aeromonas sp. BIGb0405]
MNKLYLVGAGGFAREIYSYISKKEFIVDGFKLEGFLSDYPSDLNGFNIGFKIVDQAISNKLDVTDAVIIAVSDCDFKEKLYEHYKSLGVKILTYIHETAFIGENVAIGEGTVVCPYATLTTDIQVGVAVTVNAYSSVGHDVTLGDFCTLSGHCDVTGHVYLDNKVFMGSHALIIPKVKVGQGAIIGAGSVVISKVKPGTTMFGNPAKKIK